MSRTARRLGLLAALPALGLVLAGCGSAIAQDELENQVSDALESEYGVATDVSCVGDLEAEVDATTECTATEPGSGEEIALQITVTSVEDGTAEFDIVPVE